MKIRDNKRQIIKMTGEILLTALFFFLVTMPFRRLFAVTSLTEVRPAAALPPAFGLLFGIPGALGCAVGNFVADILSGYEIRICICGFPVQFLYGLLPYLLWYGTRAGKEQGPVCFRNVRQVLKYIGIVVVDSLAVAAALGGIQQLFHRGLLFSQATLLLFFNNLVFSLILGIPIIILISFTHKESRGQVWTLTARFVLIFLLLSVVSAVYAGTVSFEELRLSVQEPLLLWNRIYERVCVAFFLLCGLSVCFLWYLEKNITVPIERLSQIAVSYAGRKREENHAKENGSMQSRPMQNDFMQNRPMQSRPMQNRLVQERTREESDAQLHDMMRQCRALSRIHGEPGCLAAAFGGMLQEVERYIDYVARITAEKQRIRTELEVASHIQEDMLPDSGSFLTDREEFTLRARMTPAREVGGDFYDYFLVDEDRLVFFVGDVSGKGVPASLFMAIAKTLLRNRSSHGAPVEEVFTHTNEDLCRDSKNGMFVTAWMGSLDLSTGLLTCVNAGHTRPMIRKNESSYSCMEEKSGFVLAGIEDTAYTRKEIVLSPGDTLFLYTDGVTEATDCENRLYGEQRLKNVLNRNPDAAPEEVLLAVWEDVSAFQGEAEQFDDIAMLALCYNGSGYRVKGGAADLSRLPEILEFVENILEGEGFSEKTRIPVQIAVDEIFSNICRYARAKETLVGVKVGQDGKEGKERRRAQLLFEDDGIPFDPLKCPAPDLSSDARERRKGGLGIYMVKKQMDGVRYEYRNGRNRLTLGKEEAYE